MSEGNKILMDFITDAVKGRRSDTYKYQNLMVILEWQGFIGSEKQDPQQSVGHQMQQFIQKPHIRHALGSGMAGLKKNGQAKNDKRQPIEDKNFKFRLIRLRHRAE